jgi:hypothetical protein
MTPLQKIAMGLVIVVVDADIAGYDGVPDVLGWLLVLLGVRGLPPLPSRGTLLGFAAAAAAVSVALVPRDLVDGLPEYAGWALSLPQVAFSFVLCQALADLQRTADPRLARRFAVLRWVFAVVALGPVLLYGGGLDVLLVPLAVLTVLANLALIYLVFRASVVVGRPETPGAPEAATR